MRYKYKLNNLDCANCANKIEAKLNKDSRIEKATVNFSNLILTVETSIEKDVKKTVSSIVKSVEPNVKVLELTETEKNNKVIFDVIRLIIGTILSILGMLIFKNKISKIFIILGYFILLFRTISNSVKLLYKSKTINENFLVTISCIGAYFTNNVHEGLMVILLYEIGKILEEIAVNNSRKSIGNLMDIKPEYANLKNGNDVLKVNPEEVKIGDIIVIKQGEKIALDGIVIKGEAKLNTAALTGESKLRSVKENDNVLSGSINIKGLLEIKVTNTYDNSTVSRILDLVEKATDRKAKTESFVSTFSKIYTPTILILAIITSIVLIFIFKFNISDAIYRSLIFLVVSCPCAIAISVPLSYFSGIGKASKEGILIKGSDYLDALSKINTIIFDKTGTITTGEFSNYELEIIDKNYTKKQIIEFYVKGEKLSNHPIAKSIIKIFDIKTNNNYVKDFEEVSGKGIMYKLNNDDIKIGSSSFCGEKKKDNYIYLSLNNKIIARLQLLDGIKKDAKKTIEQLDKMKINTKMFTGDNKEIATIISKKVGINDVYYELLPDDKYNLLQENIKTGKTVAFVGDGINDAPSLALSNIGISMGGIGSASAIEASDVVIMTDELSKIVDGIRISKKTNKIIKQNLIFAISVKVIVLILSTIGIATMWQAVFADTGVTLLTILNTTRILKK